MKLQFRLLGKRRRERVRQIARQAFMKARDPEHAKLLAEEEITAEFKSVIASILVGVAVELAIQLIVYWIKQRLQNPTPGFERGEPGADS